MPEVQHAWLTSFQHGRLQLRQRWHLAQQLRQQHYQQAIVLPNSLKSALLPFLAGIPKRTGWRGEMRWGLLNDVRFLDRSKLPMTVQRYAALGMPAGQALPGDLPYPRLQIDQNQQQAIRAKLQLTDNSRPILTLCPGAEYGPAKRWPAEYFAQVAKAKQAEGWQVWVLGSSKEVALGAHIQQIAPGCMDLTGKTSLAEAMSLLASSKIVVGNDSGLLHIAAAVGSAVIALYGSMPPEIAPPLTAKSAILYLNLPCSPCFARECPLGHFRCMRELTPDQVLQAMPALLN
jgi:heptosyltransferase-2